MNKSSESDRKIVLVGNPNVGKSVIFGSFTGRYVSVSNYPGTTVEISEGRARLDGLTEMVIDTPGVNSLLPFSEDEVVTRNILLEPGPRLVVQVADAKNLRRALFLSIQLAEMNIPFILNLNMMDEAQSRGIRIDKTRLSQILGVPVVETVAIHRRGLTDLAHEMRNGTQAPNVRVHYADEIEEVLSKIEDCLPDSTISKRSLALMILADDGSLNQWLFENVERENIAKIETIVRALQSTLQNSISAVINQRRLQKAEEIFRSVYEVETKRERGLAARLGSLSMHPLGGWPILLLVLYGLYQFVGVFGAGTLVGLVEEIVFGKFINVWADRFFAAFVPLQFLQDVFVGEYGLITMALSYSIAIVLPVVATFFIAFGILEDSGYLPRLAVMMNRVFKSLGLHGKAVLPMVLGLGCDTMATLTTRILETRKERLLVTLLLALGIPCSAQLGVILGLLGGLSFYSVFIWLLCVVGVLLLVGFLASKALPGERSDFVLEIPPIRMPSIGNILIKTVARIEWYLKEAVPLFFLGTFVLFILAKTGALTTIQVWAAPLITGLLGLPETATEAFLIGFLRRDYGAAGLFNMAQDGLLNPKQIVVSLVTITLFVPCIANFFVIIKERGWKTALAITGFIFPFAFIIGGLLNLILS